MTDIKQVPEFPFVVPQGYYWLLKRGLVGYEPFSPLQPWYYLEEGKAFWANEMWPEGPSPIGLFVFARRQDCDDLACFEFNNNEAKRIIVIHGWASSGYEIITSYDTFWDWLKSVVDDIAEWVSLGDGITT